MSSFYGCSSKFCKDCIHYIRDETKAIINGGADICMYGAKGSEGRNAYGMRHPGAECGPDAELFEKIKCT